MTKIHKLVILFLSVSTPLFAQNSKLVLRGKMMTALAEERLTGAVWSTVDTSRYISADAFGMKYNGTKRLLTDSDQVQAGSVAKTMLAAGILRLVTMNKLDLDAPVEKILTTIRFENPWAVTNPVRIRDLLNHTSGMEDFRLWQIFSKTVKANTPLLKNFTKSPSVLRIHTRPGSHFEYSNMGYTILAMVLEAVTRQRYEDYLDTYLLQPLGMTHSTFSFVTQPGKGNGVSLAMGHLDQMEWQPALPMYLRPAGQFTTTAYDMGMFLRLLMGDGSLHGYPFIRKDLLLFLSNEVVNDRVLQGLETGYGRNPPGFRSMLYLYPKERKAFFIAFNMDNKSADYQVFPKILRQSMDIQKPAIVPIQKMPADLEKWKGNYIATVPKFKLFAYFELLTRFITVIPKENQVIFRQQQQKDKVLLPIGKHLFRSVEKPIASHVFYVNDAGHYRITDGFNTYQKINSLYLWAMWMSFILGISGLFYIFSDGLISLVSYKTAFFKKIVAIPFFAFLCLGIPAYLFINQDFYALGDQTPASISAAIMSILFPLSILVGIYGYFKEENPSRSSRFRMMAFLLVFQLIVILALWGMLPFCLWR